MERAHLRNFSICTGKYSSFVSDILLLARMQSSANVCVANVHMFIEAYKDIQFNKIINDADIVTPDGMPLTWSLRLLYKIKQERVAGMDLLPDLLEELMNNNMPVYFYGGSPRLINKTEAYLKQAYPRLQIAGLYSPPFRELSEYEEEDIVHEINISGARAVFVVLGCPKQEKWMARMKGKINAVMIGVGGALPVLIGEQKRAPKWAQNLGMEWFFRLLQEPGRLFKRYAVSNSLFLYLLFWEYIKINMLKRSLNPG